MASRNEGSKKWVSRLDWINGCLSHELKDFNPPFLPWTKFRVDPPQMSARPDQDVPAQRSIYRIEHGRIVTCMEPVQCPNDEVETHGLYDPSLDDQESVHSEQSTNSWMLAQVSTPPSDPAMYEFWCALEALEQPEPVVSILLQQCDLYLRDEPLLHIEDTYVSDPEQQRVVDWGLTFFEIPTTSQIQRLLECCQDFLSY